MASNLPLSLHNKIMFFAGDIPTTNVSSENIVSKETSSISKVEEPPPSPAPEIPILSPSHRYILSQKDGPGFVVIDNFLGQNASKEVACEAMKVKELKVAGMGRGIGKFLDGKARGDSISWLPPSSSSTSTNEKKGLNILLQKMDLLKNEINKSFIDFKDSSLQHKKLNIGPLSHQLACYPGDGSGYVRHRDAYPSDDGTGRWLTMIYYLNQDWEEKDGGYLRLFLPKEPNEEKESHWDIAPTLDRLLIFRADRIDHEVLAAHRERFAITSWFSLISTKDSLPAVGPPPLPDQAQRTPPPPIKADSAIEADVILPTDVPVILSAMSETTSPIWSHLTVTTGDDTPHPTVKRRKPLQPPPPPTNEEADSSSDSGGFSGKAEGGGEPTIFVSIASYRDPECQHTVKDLFETAQYPERVFVGIVGQYDDEEDSHCFTEAPLPVKWAKQVRCLSLHARDAKGPCWARYLAQKLLKNEDYIMQIDSHMRFRPNWDSYLVATLARCPSPHPILTTYPPGYTTTGNGDVKVPIDYRPTVLCPTSFGGDGFLRQSGKLMRTIAKEPLRCYLWAGGFNFGASSDVMLAPYDPHLQFLFFGEEISMAARLWSKGVDLFAPPETVCFHLWSRALRPVHSSTSTTSTSTSSISSTSTSSTSTTQPKNAEVLKRASQTRVRSLLSMQTPTMSSSASSSSLMVHDTYGLGDMRSLTSFEDIVGIVLNPIEEGIDYSTPTKTTTHNNQVHQPLSPPYLPRVIRPDAKWGGLSSDLFDETKSAALLSALGLLNL